jgi:hypothetical protein
VSRVKVIAPDRLWLWITSTAAPASRKASASADHWRSARSVSTASVHSIHGFRMCGTE